MCSSPENKLSKRDQIKIADRVFLNCRPYDSYVQINKTQARFLADVADDPITSDPNVPWIIEPSVNGKKHLYID